ncbi:MULTISPECIES: hypothetical protein [unclassified Flagellimonas]|uniref:Uncharacterized protein n=1 Tax=Flagellimonas sp. MMG031 TaxID=3158549 RepID=A0AAU7N043_9FLAO
MENKARINKEAANLIVSLCLCIHKLKNPNLDEKGPYALLIKWTHRDLKDRLDAVLGGLSVRVMVREAGKTKDYVKNLLVIYGLLPEGLGHKNEIIGILHEILDVVTELEQGLGHDF